MSAPSDYELLPAELRTPPLGLVALVGNSTVHAAVSAHLRTELRPPLHSLSVATVDTVAQLFPARKLRVEPVQQVSMLRCFVSHALTLLSVLAGAFGRHPAR